MTEPVPEAPEQSRDYALDVMLALQGYWEQGHQELALKYLEVVMDACEAHGHFIGTWQERARQAAGGEVIQLPEWLRGGDQHE